MKRALVVAVALALAGCFQRIEPTGTTTPGSDAGTTGGGGGGNPGGCPAPTMSCGGSCTDVSTDTHNCGACGHDCGGSGCSAGLCAPVTLVSGGASVVSGPLASDGSAVYFGFSSSACPVNTSCASIGKCSVGGCAMNAFTLANPAAGTGAQVAVGNGKVYFVFSGIRSCDTSGQCLGNSAATLASGSAIALAADSAGAYFATTTTVSALPVAGGGAIQVGSGSQLAPTLAADGTHVYFADATKVYAAPDDGSAPAVTLIAGRSGITHVAVDGVNVYYGTLSGEVGLCAKSGCAMQPTVVAQLGTQVGGVAADGTNVYFSGGGIQRCPVAGCPAGGPIAVSAGGGANLAMDATNLYWTESGTIRKLAK